MDKEFELINVLEKINSTIPHIKDKQDELRIKLDSCEKKLNTVAVKIIQPAIKQNFIHLFF